MTVCLRKWGAVSRGVASRPSLATSMLFAGLCLSDVSSAAAKKGEPIPALSQSASQANNRAVPERQIVAHSRSTLDTRRTERQLNQRGKRVALQIPRALQTQVETRIQARIGRNLKKVRALREEALRLLREMLQSLPADAPEVPTTLLRLGELEWEAAREVFLERFKVWEDKPTDERSEPPVPQYRRARGRFARVLKDYPQFERYDLALYIDGFLATEEGEAEVALERFNRILSEYPQSPFVPDAHMVRAEAEFAKKAPRYEYALQEYEQVLLHPEAEVYELALFKSAWALWRLNQTEEAARRFLSVFKASAERTEQGVDSKSNSRRALGELQAEALKNLVAVFVEDEKNSAEDMHRFLVGAGGEAFAGEIVGSLAVTLYEQAHYSRGIEAYRLLVQLQPTQSDTVDHVLAIAEGHSTLEQWGPLQADYELLMSQYVSPLTDPETKQKPVLSSWLVVQDSQTIERVDRLVADRLFLDAVGLHAKAQADKTSQAEFNAAAGLYSLFVGRFSASPKAYEAYFNLGDIHYHRLNNELLAADAYLAAVRLKPEGKWSRDALYNALNALEGAREKEFRLTKAAGASQTESPTDKKLTAAMELYGETYPDDPQLPRMLFSQGRLYYDYGVYDVAVRQWGLLLEKHPEHEFARSAGELILDSFNKSEDYGNIETWGRRLLGAPAFESTKAQSRLKALIVQAIFKQGEQRSKEGKHTEAALAYVRAAREFPQDTRAAQAAVNATIEAKQAVDLGIVREAAALLMAAHRGAPEAAAGIWIAATIHQELGLLAEAAQLHEGLARHWPQDTQHRNAAFNAVLLRSSLGERDAAIAAGTLFHKSYPRGTEADEVMFLMGKAHERAEDWRAAEKLYARYARVAKLSSRRIEALVRLSVARVELQDEKGAQTALSRAMRQRKKYRKSLDDRGQYFGAKAHFLNAQRLVREYEAIAIAGDAKGLPKRLKRKAERLKRASSALLETAKFGVAEWTTAALYQVGFVYESFASALLSSPPPDTLTEEQQDDFQMQIDEFVIPIEEKSLEAYESGWIKAVELGIFNRWTAKMRVALGRLNTEQYPPIDEVGLSVRAEGGQSFPELIAAPRRTETGQSAPFLVSQKP